MFSPLRAVMFWPADSDAPEEYHLVRLGMLEYVYKPLGLPIPKCNKRFRADARATYHYATMTKQLSQDALISLLKGTTTAGCGKKTTAAPNPPTQHQWRAASKFYSSVVESMAATKSTVLSSHVLGATSFEEVIPSPVIPIEQLMYSEKSLAFLHDCAYNRLHSNPIGLLRSLTEYMSVAKVNSNMYVCMFFHSLAKACKKTITVNLLLRTKPLKKNQGVCFGPKNRSIKKVMDKYTVKMCPWCCKPVNMAVKKKSSFGGAHKSLIFTDEYTQEPLYCFEKNHRGILEFPLISADSCGDFFVNDLEWVINRGLTMVFSISQHSDRTAHVTIRHKTKGVLLFSPVETATECEENSEARCALCNKE